MACYGVMALLTLAWMPPILLGHGSALLMQSDVVGVSRGRTCSAYAAAHPPSISISIEPAALAPYADAESPVVFPGYLLPDDGCEEPAHAGS
jgi:hypothetical protein